MPGGILAIDPAKVIGWAWAAPGAEPEWGHARLGRKGCETDEIAEALSIFLTARIDICQPDWIVREDFYIGGGRVQMNPQTIYVLCGIAWQIDLMARERGIECRKVNTSAFTKFFTGRGKFDSRADKKAATMAMCKIHGWRATEDEADALALLAYAEARLYPSAAMKRAVGPLFAVEARR